MDEVRETHRQISIRQTLHTTDVECDCGWSESIEGSGKVSLADARRAWTQHRCRA